MQVRYNYEVALIVRFVLTGLAGWLGGWLGNWRVMLNSTRKSKLKLKLKLELSLAIFKIANPSFVLLLTPLLGYERVPRGISQ